MSHSHTLSHTFAHFPYTPYTHHTPTCEARLIDPPAPLPIRVALSPSSVPSPESPSPVSLSYRAQPLLYPLPPTAHCTHTYAHTHRIHMPCAPTLARFVCHSLGHVLSFSLLASPCVSLLSFPSLTFYLSLLALTDLGIWFGSLARSFTPSLLFLSYHRVVVSFVSPPHCRSLLVSSPRCPRNLERTLLRFRFTWLVSVSVFVFVSDTPPSSAAFVVAHTNRSRNCTSSGVPSPSPSGPLPSPLPSLRTFSPSLRTSVLPSLKYHTHPPARPCGHPPFPIFHSHLLLLLLLLIEFCLPLFCPLFVFSLSLSVCLCTPIYRRVSSPVTVTQEFLFLLFWCFVVLSVLGGGDALAPARTLTPRAQY